MNTPPTPRQWKTDRYLLIAAGAIALALLVVSLLPQSTVIHSDSAGLAQANQNMRETFTILGDVFGALARNLAVH